MAINAQPPQWLESLSARPVTAQNELFRQTGKQIGGLIDAALPSGDEELDKKPYFDRFRTSMQNQAKFEQDPNWRLKELVARGHYEASRMQGESMALRGMVALKTMQQQVNSEKEIAAWGAEVEKNGSGPEAILNTPYLGSNQITANLVEKAHLNASRGLVQKRLESTKVMVNKLASGLLPADLTHFLQLPRDENGNPTAEGWAYLNAASERAQAAKIKPLSTIGKLQYDLNEAQARGEDITPYQQALDKQAKSSDVQFEETTIGGKAATIVTQPGFGGFRILMHDDTSKPQIEKLKAAYRLKHASQIALTNPRIQLVGEAKTQAEKNILQAEKDIEEANAKIPAGLPADPAAPQQFKSGDKVKQNGKLYQFDGTNWNEAQ